MSLRFFSILIRKNNLFRKKILVVLGKTNISSLSRRNVKFANKSLISSDLTDTAIHTVTLNIPTYIELANLELHKTGPIDMLMSADLFWFWFLLCPNKFILGKNLPCLQETQLEWIISEPLEKSNPKETRCN